MPVQNILIHLLRISASSQLGNPTGFFFLLFFLSGIPKFPQKNTTASTALCAQLPPLHCLLWRRAVRRLRRIYWIWQPLFKVVIAILTLDRVCRTALRGGCQSVCWHEVPRLSNQVEMLMFSMRSGFGGCDSVSLGLIPRELNHCTWEAVRGLASFIWGTDTSFIYDFCCYHLKLKKKQNNKTNPSAQWKEDLLISFRSKPDHYEIFQLREVTISTTKC